MESTTGPAVINKVAAAKIDAAILSSSRFNVMNLVALAVIAAVAFYLYQRFKHKNPFAKKGVPETIVPIATHAPSAPVESPSDDPKEE